MNSDLRDSITAWAFVIVFAAFFWAVLRFGPIQAPFLPFQPLVAKIPSSWMSAYNDTMALLVFGGFIFGLWQRRASKAK